MRACRGMGAVNKAKIRKFSGDEGSWVETGERDENNVPKMKWVEKEKPAAPAKAPEKKSFVDRAGEKLAGLFRPSEAIKKRSESTTQVANYAKGGVTGGKWIQKAVKKPGALHEQMGVPKGQKIPPKKLNAAAKAPGKLGQRARLAKTLKGFK